MPGRRHLVALVALGLLLTAGCADAADQATEAPGAAGSVRRTTSSSDRADRMDRIDRIDRAATAARADATAPGTAAPVAGVVAEIGTNRLFQPRRELGLALRNPSPEPVTVRALQLVTSRFHPEPPATRVVTVPPGRRLVIPLPYGAARCGGPAGGYRVSLTVGDGRPLLVPAREERPGAVDRVHERECAAARVRSLVDVRFEGPWRRDGVSVGGELVVERRRAGPAVVVDDVTGNVIFTLRLPTADGPVMRVRSGRASVPVTITADRCDRHAVAEFKRPFTFLGWFGVGAGEPTPVELDVTGAARDALADLLASC